jgi:hypothetical protein
MVPLAVTAITKWCNQCGVMKAAAAGRLGRYQAEAGLSRLNQAAAVQQDRSKPKP